MRPKIRIISAAPADAEAELQALEDYTAIVWGITAAADGAVTVTCVSIDTALLRQSALASGVARQGGNHG